MTGRCRDAPDPANAASTARWRTITTVLLVVLALMLGGIAGYGLTRLGVPGDDSPEAGFARDMSAHHGQVVSMAGTLHRAMTDAGLALIAIDMVTTQQGQIGMMQAWLADWDLGPNSGEGPMAWMGHTSHHDSNAE